MTSTDRAQVTTVILRLGELINALNPVTVVTTLAQTIRMVADPPPGDAEAIETLADAFRRAGGDVAPIATDVRRLGSTTLPELWKGTAGASAARVMGATADLVDATTPAFTVAESALRDYATVVADVQRRHAALLQALSEAWHDATHITVLGQDVSMVDVAALGRLVRRVEELIIGCRAGYAASVDAADTLAGRLADVAGRARAGANRGHYPAATSVVLADAGIGGAAAIDNLILSPAQATRAAQRRDQLSAADRARLDAALAAAPTPEHRAYILKALAAGHSIDEVLDFAGVITSRDDAWLRKHLTLIDPAQPGATMFGGAPIRQVDDYTCGSTSIVMARALADPLYALRLTAGDDPNAPGADRDATFADRLSAEEHRVHDATNTVWPQRLGTTPWGVTNELNDHADSLGTGYDMRLVDDTRAGSVDPALREAVSAVDRGHPVPVLIGGAAPRHYVLLVGHDGSDLYFYEPSDGAVVTVDERDFRNGAVDKLGFPHVQAVIVPTS